MNEVIKSFDDLQALVNSPETEKDINKARGGNKSAILRVRKLMKHIGSLSKKVANEAQLVKKLEEQV